MSEANITAEATARLSDTPNARLKEIVIALTRHLHDFAREVRLTPSEWTTGIEFLTRTGQMSDDKRQEFILLSDTLGLSALVDMIEHANSDHGGTASSLLGPFYRPGMPELKNGESIAHDLTQGEPLSVKGRVINGNGKPLANALIDVWQAAANGLYDLQDPNQPEINMRGRFRSEPDGRFAFRTTKPMSYSVPTDGPVGKLLRAEGRHSFRPAHIHFLISAEGYETLTTALYIAGDRYIDSDAVFGAKDELTVDYIRGGAEGVDALEFTFALSSRE
ncbi:MAG TPA: dioxygenase [Candidatus Binataceae bacterium]|nr:dioxygenase [Candidatus Binataceae bacterium]